MKAIVGEEDNFKGNTLLDRQPHDIKMKSRERRKTLVSVQYRGAANVDFTPNKSTTILRPIYSCL